MDDFDFDFKRTGRFTVLDPDDVEISQHTTIEYAQEAALRHSIQNRINGEYSIVPPTWRLKTMGFGITPVPGPDRVPGAFSFINQNDVDLSSVYPSNIITPIDYNAETTISVVGGEYRINGGTYTSAAGLINPGDTVQVRHTTAAAENTTTDTTLTIGGISAVFSTTTETTTPPASGEVDISLLVAHNAADVNRSQRDEVAYDALNVFSQSAGFVYADPATGHRVTKCTDGNFPGTEVNFVHAYSGEGRQISGAWGPNGDMYTCIVMEAVSVRTYAFDYQLGVGPDLNSGRRFPFTEANFSFLLSDPQIAIGLVGGQLRRYNTAIDDYDEAGTNFPYDWTTSGIAWFNVTGDESWCTAILTQGSQVTALRLSDGLVRNRTITGMDELYAMAGPSAIIGITPTAHWDLENDVVTTIRSGVGDDDPLSGNGVFHAIANYRWNNGNPTDDFVMHYDINSGNTYISTRINGDGTTTPGVDLDPYIAGMHSCGYATKAPGDMWRMVVMGQYGTQVVGPGYDESMFIYDSFTGFKYELPHTYSNWQSGTDVGNGAGVQSYYDQPKPHWSEDGKIVMFTNNMNGNQGYAVNIAELPRSAA